MLTTASEAAQQTPSPGLGKIGRPGEPIRVISLASGGFDTAMQLGMAHAFLLTRSAPPDVIAGSSAGALHAAMLAEVLCAGQGAPSERERILKQVETFTRLLEAELSAAGQLRALLLPDAYQVNSRAPLEPLRTPTQSKLEREHREKGVWSRLGLIRVINDILAVRISIGEMTLFARALLGYRAAGEAPSTAARRWQEQQALWHVCGTCLLSIRPFAYFTKQSLSSIVAALVGCVRRWIGVPRGGKSAGAIMFGGLIGQRILRWPGEALQWIVAVLVNAAGWLLLVGFCLLAFLRAVGSSLMTLRPGRNRLGRKDPRPSGPLPNARPPALLRVLRSLALLILDDLDLRTSVLESEVMRGLLIRTFDPTYYGKINAAEFDAAVDRSLHDPQAPAQRARDAKRLDDFERSDPPIVLGIAAADLCTGELALMRADLPLVDALLAATAAVPWFAAQKDEVTKQCLVEAERVASEPSPRGESTKPDEAQKVSSPPTRQESMTTRWFVDARSVSREPTQVVMELLRERALDGATEVLIYPMRHLTQADRTMKPAEDPFPTWIDVAGRAGELNEMRDAQLEWRLTRLVTRTLPAGRVRYRPAGEGTKSCYLRASIVPIEPEAPVAIADAVLSAETEDARHELILGAIADGCRATMKRLVPASIESCREDAMPANAAVEISCSVVIGKRSPHLGALPMSSGKTGPGFERICARCALHTATERKRAYLRGTPPNGAPEADWPLAMWANKDTAHQTVVPRPPSPASSVVPNYSLASWPRARALEGEVLAGKEKPLVSMLFSGGVFRGVYLVGVVNALNELGVRPDIIAGASVGTVTAALAADVFSQEDSSKRARQLARFASVFLRLDRFILTDRCADFVRTFTLRAAQTRFSLRDVDHALRRFDEGDQEQLSADVRRVLAGFERLCYVTPFDFFQIVHAVRCGRTAEARRAIDRQLRRWLRRDNADEEVLGSEPIARILEAYVLGDRAGGGITSDVPFQAFLDSGIYMLATATNLTTGDLTVLGDLRGADLDRLPASLEEVVLASSAFPGIFRPRRSWEVFRGTGNQDQFTDGGVMDNLPLDAVAQFIDGAAKAKLVARRPRVGGQEVPHLLFTASLEADPITNLTPKALKRVATNWMLARQRTKELACNRKIESYKTAQRHLRLIYQTRGTVGPEAFVPADLEIVDVRPQWLCSTFGFHPMTGFRHQRQAESIAHGCASTIVRMQKEAQANRTWTRAWGVREQGDGARDLVPNLDRPHADGTCAFREGETLCPFSPKALVQVKDLGNHTRRELAEIYFACRRPESHQRPPS